MPTNSKQSGQAAIILLSALIVIVFALSFYFLTPKNASFLGVRSTLEEKSATRSATPFSPSTIYTIDLKTNPNDSTLTDVYLKDSTLNPEIYFLTLDHVNTSVNQPVQLQSSSLYVIERPNPKSANWTDEIWRYNLNTGVGQKLYSSRGINFSVSPNQARIAILDPENNLTIIDANGQILKSFSKKSLLSGANFAYPLTFLKWNGADLWLAASSGPEIASLTKITPNFEINKYSLLITLAKEYAFSPDMRYILISSYPSFSSTKAEESFKSSNQTVNLYLYDIEHVQSKKLASSLSKRFDPAWTSNTTYQYQSPDSENLVTGSIN